MRANRRNLFLSLAMLSILVTANAQEPKDTAQVYVVGGVETPRAIDLKGSLTLTQAISAAGGIKKDAKGNNVVIYRSFEKVTLKTCVTLSEIKNQRTEDLTLQANDILDVRRGRCANPLCWAIEPTIDRSPIRIIK